MLTEWKQVAPLAGAWIEILLEEEYEADIMVAPLAGAWIEILLCSKQYEF